MRALLISAIILAFITGFLACYLTSNIYNTETPYSGLANLQGQPGDWVKENNIQVFNDKIVIYVDNAILSRYAGTGSMLPTFGDSANGIRIIPNSAEEIKIGDIVSFERNNLMVVHRVVEKGTDENGTWFVTKGDNNSESDEKIYFENIKYVTIGIIY